MNDEICFQKKMNSEFYVLNGSLDLSVPPIFASNPKAGVQEMLDSVIMRYIPAFNGVVLSHSNAQFRHKNAVIQKDCPFLICSVTFDALVWRPTVGLKLAGVVNLCSPDHISLLVHRTFNVSIPRNHIPQDDWVFEYGPAENDPEFAVDSVSQTDPSIPSRSTGGRWVHKVTGKMLGGDEGRLDFTVIGLIVANEMLSLLGSLQPDPLSPRHALTTAKPDTEESTSEEEDEDEPDGEDDSSEDNESEGIEWDESTVPQKTKRKRPKDDGDVLSGRKRQK